MIEGGEDYKVIKEEFLRENNLIPYLKNLLIKYFNQLLTCWYKNKSNSQLHPNLIFSSINNNWISH